MTRMLARKATRQIGLPNRSFVADQADVQGGTQLLCGSMLAGVAIGHVGTGSAEAGACSYDSMRQVTHRLACMLMLDPVMRFNKLVAEGRFTQRFGVLRARREGRASAVARVAIVRIARLHTGIGLPRRLPTEAPGTALVRLADQVSYAARLKPGETNPSGLRQRLLQVISGIPSG